MHNSYIVRVYRLEKDNPRLLVGTVEKVGAQGKTAFTNLDELWEIMNAGRDHGIGTNDSRDQTEVRKMGS
jgi:hypothetical protein